MKLRLTEVTLIAMTGLDYKVKEHEAAMEKSSKGIIWGDRRIVKLSTITDIDSWNRAIIYDLPYFVHTLYAMLIHHDGYVIHPECWQEEFLNYDYIGAPWPIPSPLDTISYRDQNGLLRRVGNSVSLRSKRLINFANEKNLPWKAYHGFTNEDGFICVNNVLEYEKAGMRIAPLSIAKYFSKEHEIPENVGLKTFAFHSTT